MYRVIFVSVSARNRDSLGLGFRLVDEDDTVCKVTTDKSVPIVTISERGAKVIVVDGVPKIRGNLRVVMAIVAIGD